MKNLIYLILILFISGCETINSDDYLLASSSIPEAVVPIKALTKIDLVNNGMTYEKVMTLMEGEVNFGGTITKNPYRIETLSKNGLEYLVIFFVTQINILDDPITDDELTPVVFKESLVVGKSWEFLKAL